MTVVAAIDCGATSVRVCRVDLSADTLVPQIVHRVSHAPVLDASGHLRWDWDLITAAVTEGLNRAMSAGPIASIGVDTWAVDYGLLDKGGKLLSAPYAYRDHRTDNYRDLVDAFGAEAMYRINGLQLQPFNTVFQLAYHDADELARADRLLWLPELIVHHLTGIAVTERTSAGSSGLLDVTKGRWASELLRLAGVDSELLGEIQEPAQIVGQWRGVPVSLVAGHDTASAVVGMGSVSAGGSVFVSSGTWMLVGVERPTANTSEWARLHNFTNEASVDGGIRFLKNVTGFWLLEQCRPAWGNPDVAHLVDAAEAVEGAVPRVDVDHDDLRAPTDMLDAYLTLSGLPGDVSPGTVTRSIIESIVDRTAQVVEQLAHVASFEDLVLFGGAARMALLARRLEERTGLPVRTGQAEAAALGNALVQGVALGHFESIEQARSRLKTTESRRH